MFCNRKLSITIKTRRKIKKTFNEKVCEVTTKICLMKWFEYLIRLPDNTSTASKCLNEEIKIPQG